MRSRVNLSVAAIALGIATATTGSAQSRPDWFQMPSTASLRAAPQKVFAHYFPQFPLQINNKTFATDYYTTQYLNPLGEGGKWAFCGGFLRERPLEVPGAGSYKTNWQFENFQTEVRRAIMIGLDGFEYNLLATSGSHWTNLLLLLSAAQSVDSGFKIKFKPDMSAMKANPEGVYNALLGIKNHPSLFRTPDGRIVVSPYMPNVQGLVWWQNMLRRWSAAGVRVAFVPCFQGWKSYVDDWAPISYGIMHWGNDNSVGNAALKSKHNLKVFSNTVTPQYFRPNALLYREAKGSQMYRENWESMIKNKVDWVDVATWNDYSECTEIAPSTGIGTSFFELTAYYATWMKTGVQPTVVKDRLFLFNRREFVAGTAPSTTAPTSGFKKAGAVTRVEYKTQDTPADVFEVTAFLVSPANIQVTVGTKTYQLSGVAGKNSFYVPLSNGTPSVSAFRNGSLVAQISNGLTVTDGGAQPNLLYQARVGASVKP